MKFHDNLPPGFQSVAAALLIALLVAAVYAPVVNQGYFNWDDPKHVRAVWKPSLQRAWRIVTDFDLSYTQVAYYIPLHFLTLMADQAARGDRDRPDAGGSKAVNAGLHALNAILLFLLMNMLGAGRYPSLIGALIFALHPVQVGTVAWVVERKNVLSIFFYMASLIFFARYCVTRRIWQALVVVFLFACGLLSKPSVVTLPVVMLALPVFVRNPNPDRPRPWITPAVLLIMAAAWSLYVVSTEVSYPGIVPPWYCRPLLAAGVIWSYVAKFVWPVGLAVLYPRWDVMGHIWTFALLFVALVGVVASTGRRVIREPLILWGAVLFLANVLPVSGLVPFGYMGHSFIADHLAYLPLAGLAVIVTGLIEKIDARVKERAGRVAFHAGCWLVVAALAVLSAQRVQLWGDSARLWEETLEVNKTSAAAYHNYAAILMDRRQYDDALIALQRVTELAPNLEIAYNNMGRIYLARKERDAAIRMFDKSIEVKPNVATARILKARSLKEEGRAEEALRFLEESALAVPNNPDLTLELAERYQAAGRWADALSQLDKAAKLAPMSPAPLVAKARLLLSRQDFDSAIDPLQRAVSMGDSSGEAHNLLGIAYANTGRMERALTEFLAASRLRPDLPGLSDNAANAYLDLGNPSAARDFCRRMSKSPWPCSRATLERLAPASGPAPQTDTTK